MNKILLALTIAHIALPCWVSSAAIDVDSIVPEIALPVLEASAGGQLVNEINWLNEFLRLPIDAPTSVASLALPPSPATDSDLEVFRQRFCDGKILAMLLRALNVNSGIPGGVEAIQIPDQANKAMRHVLATSSTNAIVLIDKLQPMIDALHEYTKRGVTEKPSNFQAINLHPENANKKDGELLLAFIWKLMSVLKKLPPLPADSFDPNKPTRIFLDLTGHPFVIGPDEKIVEPSQAEQGSDPASKPQVTPKPTPKHKAESAAAPKLSDEAIKQRAQLRDDTIEKREKSKVLDYAHRVGLKLKMESIKTKRRIKMESIKTKRRIMNEVRQRQDAPVIEELLPDPDGKYKVPEPNWKANKHGFLRWVTFSIKVEIKPSWWNKEYTTVFEKKATFRRQL